MLIAVSGAPEALCKALEAEMLAGGVPDDADVFATFDAPWVLKGVASLGVRDFWFFVKSEGSPAVIHKAEGDNEKATAERAVRRGKADRENEAASASSESLEATKFDDDHPGTSEVSTPDMDGGDNPSWHLQTQRKSDPLAALKALASRLEALVPVATGVHPLRKSFLLSMGYGADDVAAGRIEMTSDLNRKYQKWLATNIRADAARMLERR